MKILLPSPVQPGLNATPSDKVTIFSDGNTKALIPLTEFREQKIMNKYAVQTDIEMNIVAKSYWGDAREKLLDYQRSEIGLNCTEKQGT
ncbi:hypothetical protein HN51_031266 [Arachis hypogaea]